MATKKQEKIAELDNLLGITKGVVKASEEELPDENLPAEVAETELAEIEVDIKELAELNDETFKNDLKRDYYETRKTLKGLIQKGETALNKLIGVANEGEHPRAYEVVSTLIKTIAEVSNNLVELQKTVRALSEPTGEGGGTGGGSPGVPNGSEPVVMVASFQEMLDMMDEQRREGAREGKTIDGDSITS